MTSDCPIIPASVPLSSYFPSCTDLPGVGRIRSRSGSTPAPYCITLIDLVDLDGRVQPPHTSWDIRELLSPAEEQKYASFTYRKRKQEWLGGRLAAKSAVLTLLQVVPGPGTMNGVSILPAADGSPQITAHFLSPHDLPSLSISHSDGYAVAMAAHAPACGIDIQKISTKTERVAERFCSEQEAKLLQEGTSLLSLSERLTLLWSAKEAVKKALLHDQPAIFHGVVLVSAKQGETYTLFLHYPGDHGRPAQVTAVRLEDWFLASVVRGSHHA